MSELRRVGLNLLYLVPGETGGVDAYARSLIPHLSAPEHGLELVAFVNREAAGIELEGTRLVGVDVSGRSLGRRVIAEQRRLPRLAREHGIELLHSLGTTAPRRPGTASVVTIHDVIYARLPQTHTPLRRLGMRTLVPMAARGADRVITQSAASASDIAEFLGVPQERIDVIPIAGRAPGPATPEPELRRRLGLGDSPFILCVSPRRPHKNLERLYAALAGLDSDPAPLLVLPGYGTSQQDDLDRSAAALGIADRLRTPGWVSDPDLEGLYAAATCFVFPSLAEGFGMPVLEAMQRGLPVASSNATSLPEVGGDAVLYFDPLDRDEIAAAVAKLLADEPLRRRLAAAGRERAELFTWERTARETVDSYRRAWRGLRLR